MYSNGKLLNFFLVMNDLRPYKSTKIHLQSFWWVPLGNSKEKTR